MRLAEQGVQVFDDEPFPLGNLRQQSRACSQEKNDASVSVAAPEPSRPSATAMRLPNVST
jgi:hypothetical protein